MIPFPPSTQPNSCTLLPHLTPPPRCSTVPVYETLAAVQCLPEGIGAPGMGKTEGLHFLTAGEEGVLKLWNQKGSCLWTQEAEVGASVPLIDLTVCHESETVLAVRGDHNLCFHDARTMDRERQLVGFNDEILDLCLTPTGKEALRARLRPPCQACVSPLTLASDTADGARVQQ